MLLVGGFVLVVRFVLVQLRRDRRAVLVEDENGFRVWRDRGALTGEDAAGGGLVFSGFCRRFGPLFDDFKAGTLAQLCCAAEFLHKLAVGVLIGGMQARPGAGAVARRRSAEHPIATKAPRLHSYGPDAH